MHTECCLRYFQPKELIVARLGSPIAIGLGDSSFYVGSDATPFLDHTRKVIYLEDNELAVYQKGKINIKNIISDGQFTLI